MYFKHHIAETIEKPKKELEPFILKGARTSYEYSKRILKKRWPKAEKSIIEICDKNYPWIPSDLEYVYLYSKNVIKSRWKKAEDLLLKYLSLSSNSGSKNFVSKISCMYAKNVIKGRWKDIEQYVIQTDQIGNYLDILKNEKEIKDFHRAVQLYSLKDGKSSHAKNFALWKPTHKIKVKGAKAFSVMILKNPLFSKRPNEHEFLVFKLEEWLNQAKEFNSGSHYVVRTYYTIKPTSDTSAKGLAKELQGGTRTYRSRKIDAVITEI